MNLWSVEHFLTIFCHHFWVGLLLLYCCTHPKVMTKMFKKCSTDQRSIWKRNTTYKIHTLEHFFSHSMNNFENKIPLFVLKASKICFEIFRPVSSRCRRVCAVGMTGCTHFYCVYSTAYVSTYSTQGMRIQLFLKWNLIFILWYLFWWGQF